MGIWTCLTQRWSTEVVPIMWRGHMTFEPGYTFPEFGLCAYHKTDILKRDRSKVENAPTKRFSINYQISYSLGVRFLPFIREIQVQNQPGYASQKYSNKIIYFPKSLENWYTPPLSLRRGVYQVIETCNNNRRTIGNSGATGTKVNKELHLFIPNASCVFFCLGAARPTSAISSSITELDFQDAKHRNKKKYTSYICWSRCGQLTLVCGGNGVLGWFKLYGTVVWLERVSY